MRRIIFVVEAARWEREACRRIGFIPLEQRRYVVGTLLLILRDQVERPVREPPLEPARLGNNGKVWRDRIVARARRLIVREGWREIIGQPAGALEHFALVVGPILDLVFGRDGLRLRGGKAGPTWVREIAEGDQLQAVADRAHLAIDLEAALELPP